MSEGQPGWRRWWRSQNPCPPGLCQFKCPGQKDYGCAPPGSTVECKDGTKITLPKDCGKPSGGGGGVVAAPFPIFGPGGVGIGVVVVGTF